MRRKRESLADQIVNEFLEEIQSGGFSYGEKLPSHDKLAEYFDVSRIVIREALHKLSVHGIVHFHQGKGTYIKSQDELIAYPAEIMQFTFNSPKNIFPILESRRILEKEICVLASQRRDDEDCMRLEELNHLMEQNHDNRKLYSKYDLEFHMTIAKASKNPVLIQLQYITKDLYSKEMMPVFSIPGILEESTKTHKEIYKAIVNKDSVKAGQLMEEHIRFAENLMKKERALNNK